VSLVAHPPLYLQSLQSINLCNHPDLLVAFHGGKCRPTRLPRSRRRRASKQCIVHASYVTTDLTCPAWVGSDVDPHLILGSLSLHESAPQTASPYSFSRFCTAHPCGQRTDRLADHVTCDMGYVAKGCTYRLHAAM